MEIRDLFFLFQYFYPTGLFDVFFPRLQVLKPRFGSFIAERLFHGGKRDVISHRRLFRGLYLIEVIGFIVYFAYDIFLWKVCSEADGFFGIFYRIVHRPVRTPATDQSFVVAI